MRRLLPIVAAAFAALISVCGCGKTDPNGPDNKGSGTLELSMSHDISINVSSLTSEFTRAITAADLTVEIAQGNEIANRYAPIGTVSKNIALNPGDYTVRAYSETLFAPKFDTPVYGDTQSVTIQKGKTSSVTLNCCQTNAGVIVNYSGSFQSTYANYQTQIAHAGGSLTFAGADASRTGYFPAGNVDLTITADGQTFYKSMTLEARRLYTVTIDQNPSSGDNSGNLSLNITISTDVVAENVTLTLPPAGGVGGEVETDIFFERFGAANVATATGISSFSEWSEQTVTYDGSQARIVSTEYSDYEGASRGNSVRFLTGGIFTIEGIDCSGFTSVKLKVGMKAAGMTFRPADLTIKAYNGLVATPLTYTRGANDRWEWVTITTNVPVSSSLKLEFTGAQGYKIDDIKLTGTR